MKVKYGMKVWFIFKCIDCLRYPISALECSQKLFFTWTTWPHTYLHTIGFYQHHQCTFQFPTLRWMAKSMYFAGSSFVFIFIDKRTDEIMFVCKATTVCLICTTTMARLLPRTSVRKFLIYSPLCRITHQLVMWMWCGVSERRFGVLTKHRRYLTLKICTQFSISLFPLVCLCELHFSMF